MTKIEAFELAMKFIIESRYVGSGTVELKDILEIADKLIIWSQEIPKQD